MCNTSASDKMQEYQKILNEPGECSNKLYTRANNRESAIIVTNTEHDGRSYEEMHVTIAMT